MRLCRRMGRSLVRREPPVAVWVGMKRKEIPTLRQAQGRLLSQKTRQGWGTRIRERSDRPMDITWLDEDGRIGVGGGIWKAENMAKVAKEGITHIIDMQIECDDRKLGPGDYGICVLWIPTNDDFEPKRAGMFRRGVRFAENALKEPGTKLFIHCAAGVHRAPMMALAVLCRLKEMSVHDARDLIEDRRPVADFAEVYVDSVRAFLAQRER